MNFTKKSYRIVSMTGVALVAILLIVAMLLHVSPDGAKEEMLFYFSVVFSLVHAILYFLVYATSKDNTETA